MDDRNHFIVAPKVECILSSEAVNHDEARSFLSDFLLHTQVYISPTLLDTQHQTILKDEEDIDNMDDELVEGATSAHDLNHDHVDMWAASTTSAYKEETIARLTGILFAMSSSKDRHHKDKVHTTPTIENTSHKKRKKHTLPDTETLQEEVQPTLVLSNTTSYINEDEYEDEEEHEEVEGSYVPLGKIKELDTSHHHHSEKKEKKKRKKDKKESKKDKRK